MPFCPHCGKEVNGGVKFCPECGEKLKKGFAEEVEGFTKEIEGFAEEVQKNVQELEASVKKEKSGRNTNIIAGVIVGVVFLLLLLFAGFVEFIACPRCGGTPLIEHFCGFCGGDGRITLIEYLIHLLAN